MSIKQKRTLTEKSAAAHRENAQKSRGPATPEGKQRQRDASLRHGFYSKDRDKALQALGEDPGDFDAMVRAVREKYPPVDGFEEALGMRLARAMWRMDRADRMLEGYALRQAEEASRWRENRLHSQMMKLKMAGASLLSLAQSVAKKHYVTSPADLAMMKNLLPEESLKEMGDIMLALFLQLREPGEHDEEGRHIDPHEKSRRALQKFKEIFGLAGDTPPVVRRPVFPGQEPMSREVQPGGAEVPPRPPEIKKPAPPPEPQGPQLSPEEWAKREPVRQLLENILARQAELCEAQRTALLRECLAGPSSFERAAEIAPTHPNAILMQRMQDSSFREVWRLSNLLLKLKRQGPGRESGEGRPDSGNGPDNPAPPFSSHFEPGEGPASADLRVSATIPTAEESAGRKSGIKLPPSETLSECGDSSPLLLAAPRRGASFTSCCPRSSRKKDAKMKVYPDKSNRISKTPDPHSRLTCGGRRLHCRMNGVTTPCHGQPAPIRRGPARARAWPRPVPVI